jgi:hypothetical protein
LRRRTLWTVALMVAGLGTTCVVTGSGSAAGSASAPSNTARPGISGRTRDGSTLTTSNGSWANSPTSFQYAWERCDTAGGACSDIGGANSKQYTLTSGDIGHRLRARVVAVNSAGSGSSTSTPTATIAAAVDPPANRSRPSISGRAREGSTLTTSNGSWTNSPTAFHYAWERCDTAGGACADISGAGGKQYTLTSSDVGHRLRARVSASNSTGSGSSTSTPTGTIASAGSAPTNQARPRVSGNPQEGAALTIVRGRWGGAGISVSQQWTRCDSGGNNCADIGGATGTSYTLGSADVSHTVRVREIARNSRGTTSATSDPTALIAPAKSGAAAISIAQVGLPDRLVVDRVTFSPRPLRSHGTLTARFHVSDLRGFSIQGALVYALGLPYGWVRNSPEVLTDGSGWATIPLHATRNLPLRKGGALVVFVRARKPGESLLAGISTRRLVQASVGAPR